MINARAKMINVEKEINDFLDKNPKVTSVNFPFKEYKSLHEKIIETHIEIATKESDINIEEGNKWFRDQVRKLTDFIP